MSLISPNKNYHTILTSPKHIYNYDGFDTLPSSLENMFEAKEQECKEQAIQLIHNNELALLLAEELTDSNNLASREWTKIFIKEFEGLKGELDEKQQSFLDHTFKYFGKLVSQAITDEDKERVKELEVLKSTEFLETLSHLPSYLIAQKDFPLDELCKHKGEDYNQRITSVIEILINQKMDHYAEENGASLLELNNKNQLKIIRPTEEDIKNGIKEHTGLVHKTIKDILAKNKKYINALQLITKKISLLSSKTDAVSFTALANTPNGKDLITPYKNEDVQKMLQKTLEKLTLKTRLEGRDYIIKLLEKTCPGAFIREAKNIVMGKRLQALDSKATKDKQAISTEVNQLHGELLMDFIKTYGHCLDKLMFLEYPDLANIFLK